MLITTAPHLTAFLPEDVAIFPIGQIPNPFPAHVTHVEFLIAPEPDDIPTLDQHVLLPMQLTHRLLNENPNVRSVLFITCDPDHTFRNDEPVEWKVIRETLRGFCRNLRCELLDEIRVSFHPLERFSPNEILALGKDA